MGGPNTAVNEARGPIVEVNMAQTTRPPGAAIRSNRKMLQRPILFPENFIPVIFFSR